MSLAGFLEKLIVVNILSNKLMWVDVFGIVGFEGVVKAVRRQLMDDAFLLMWGLFFNHDSFRLTFV